MPRVAKPKKLAQVAATRDGSIYGLQFEDEAGKKAVFELTSDQALRLADSLDNLLADEEQEQRPTIPDPKSASKVSGTVKWYNVAKGFGFVFPDRGGGELFVHRSVLEQAGLEDLAEGTRVHIQIKDGKKGPEIGVIALA
jgi:cold shock CspA family protein